MTRVALRSGARRVLVTVVSLALLALVRGDAGARAQSAEDELVVVLNARNPTRELTRAQLQSLFLGTSSFWHGVVPVRVIVRSPSSGAGRKLLEVLGLSSASFNERWQVRQLAGQGVSPRTAGTPSDVIAQVRQSPGAIGVILRSEIQALGATDGVRLISVH